MITKKITFVLALIASFFGQSATTFATNTTFTVGSKNYSATDDPTDANTVWYYLGARSSANTGYEYWSSASNNCLSTSNAGSGNEYLWCFVGDATNGYKLYNRGSGQYAYVDVPTTSVTQPKVTMSSTGTAFDIANNTSLSTESRIAFKIHGQTNTYGIQCNLTTDLHVTQVNDTRNFYGTNGSTGFAFTATIATNDYTVAITNGESTSTVTYKGTSVTTGNTFSIPVSTVAPQAADFTASAIANKYAQITVDNTAHTVSVNYVDATNYTVTITGDNTSATVSYNGGTGVTTGNTLAIPTDVASTLTSASLTASSVTGETSVITVDNTNHTINVAYYIPYAVTITGKDAATVAYDNGTGVTTGSTRLSFKLCHCKEKRITL